LFPAIANKGPDNSCQPLQQLLSNFFLLLDLLCLHCFDYTASAEAAAEEQEEASDHPISI